MSMMLYMHIVTFRNVKSESGMASLPVVLQLDLHGQLNQEVCSHDFSLSNAVFETMLDEQQAMNNL